jgi:hypothetical protein
MPGSITAAIPSWMQTAGPSASLASVPCANTPANQESLTGTPRHAREWLRDGHAANAGRH